MPFRELRFRLLGLAPAAAVLIWRAIVLPLPLLWQDLLAWLAVYWILTTALPDSRRRDGIAVSIAAFLLAVYGWGQGRLIASVLGLGS